MIGFCSLALRKLPIEDAIRQITESGFREIEVWYAHVQAKADAELRDLARFAAERGAILTVLSPYFFFTRGEKAWNESLENARRVVHCAGLLGIPKVRTFVDAGPDGLASTNARPEHWDAAIRGLQALCALDRSREFVVETHENTLADTLPCVQRLLDEVGEPNLKLNYQSNSDFLDRGFIPCLETLWPHVSHMHWQQAVAGQHEGYLEDPGLIDFSALAALVTQKDYRGTISVEYCWPDVDPARIRSAAAYLDGLFPGGW